MRACMQGNETQARKRLPADMAPPWKVGHCASSMANAHLTWLSIVALLPNMNHHVVAALLQVMLLSDGSVTRHLQLLTDLPVQVVSSLTRSAVAD